MKMHDKNQLQANSIIFPADEAFSVLHTWMLLLKLKLYQALSMWLLNNNSSENSSLCIDIR